LSKKLFVRHFSIGGGVVGIDARDFVFGGRGVKKNIFLEKRVF
jgi:hypothetical protein